MPDLLDTTVENRQLVQPNHANNLGTVHGGNVLKWMDEVGAMSAMRFAGRACVTAHINSVNFERPIQVGEIAHTRAYVYEVGQTSVRVRVRAYGEDPLTGESEQTTESHFVFVAIDDDHRPTPVPELEVASEEGQRLREEAYANGGNH